MPADLVSIQDAAAIIGVTRYAVYDWFRSGKIGLYGHPGSYRVSVAECLPRVTAKNRLKPHLRPHGFKKKSVRSGKQSQSAEISAPDPAAGEPRS